MRMPGAHVQIRERVFNNREPAGGLPFASTRRRGSLDSPLNEPWPGALDRSSAYESWGGKYTHGMREVCELMKVDLKDLEKRARKQLRHAAGQEGQPDKGGAGDEAAHEGSAA